MAWFRTCPRCASRLEVVRQEGVEIDRCDRCGGIWLDAGEFRTLLNARKDLVDLLPAHVRANLSATGRSCPACRSPMAPVAPTPLLQAAAEICPRDGGCWIDGSELERMRAEVERRTPRLMPVDPGIEGHQREAVQARVDRIAAAAERSRKMSDAIARRNDACDEWVEEVSDLDIPRSIASFLGLPAESGALFHLSSIVTLLLLVLNIAVFVLGAAGSGRPLGILLGGLPEGWGASYGFTPVEFEAAPRLHLWTLLTSTFVHAGLLHLLGNLYFLFTTGDDVESRMGPVAFLLFYLGGGIAANLLSLWGGRGPDVPHVGASGAIAAVMGAYLVLFPRKRFFLRWRYSLRLFGVNAWAYLAFWGLIQAAGLRASGSPVDYAAHLGGLGFGVLAGLVVHLLQRYDAEHGRWTWKFSKITSPSATGHAEGA